MRRNREKQIDADNLGISFIFDLPNPIIITHGDVDGLCAAGILLKEFRRHGIMASVFITQPFSLHSVLNDIRRNNLRGNLIIVDLALTEKSVKYKDSDGNICCRIPRGSIIIDHHPSSLKFRKYLDDNGVYHKIIIEYSASQLVGELVPDTIINNYMIRLGGVGDWKIVDKKLGEESMRLSAAMSWKYKDDDFRLEIMRMLINGKNINEMDEVYERSKLAFAKLDQIKKEGSEIFRGNNFILMFYEEGFSRASALASKLSVTTKKIALILSLLSGNKFRYLLTIRSPDKINGKDVNLLEILNEFNMGKDGGGLKKAVSFTIRKDQLGELVQYLEKKDIDLGSV